MAVRATDGPDYAYKGELASSIGCGDVIASDIIYKGGLCYFAAAGGITPVPATGLKFAGIALETVDNSAGALGDKTVRYVHTGEVLLTGISATMARANEADVLYGVGDNVADCTLTASTNPPLGIITRFVSASSVWLALNDNRTIAA
jgi:hypothetical protein